MSENNDDHVKYLYSWRHSCATGLQRKVCSFTWTIENFSFLTQKARTDVKSNAFPCCENTECKWLVKLYPTGDSTKDSNYVSMYLEYLSKNPVSVYADFTFSLRNSNNELLWKRETSQNLKNLGTWGWPSQLHINRLKKELKNDVLKIHVDLIVFAENKQKSLKNIDIKLSTFSSTNSVFEKCTLTWTIRNFLVVTKLSEQSLSSDTFYETEDSEWKWRLVLKTESGKNDGTGSDTVVLQLIAEEKPSDVDFPIQYRIMAKNPCNLAFNKVFTDKLIFSVDKKCHALGEVKELVDIFTNGLLQIQVDIIAGTDTLNRENYTIVSHEQCFKSAEYFSNMIEHAEYSDFSLFVRGKEIATHREILAARSPVFASMLRHDTLEKQEAKVEIEDVSFETMKNMLRFMYTDQFAAEDDESVIEMLKVSDKYQMDDLKEMCEDYLIYNLNVANAREILSCAETYQALNLKDEATNFINMFVDDFVLSFRPYLI